MNDNPEEPGNDNDNYEEDEAYYEAQEAELQRDLSRRIEELNEGTLRELDIIGTIMQAGKYHRAEAQPGIKRELRSDDSEVRHYALQVLTLELGLDDLEAYWEDARRFLEEDSDFSVRSIGSTALGVIKRNTHDRRTLEVLARVVSNNEESEWLRRGAYSAMLSVLGYSNMQQSIVSSEERFKFPKDVDWDMVNSYLEPSPEK